MKQQSVEIKVFGSTSFNKHIEFEDENFKKK